ncbi:MAG: hypothetical protein GXZ14_00850 [Ruminococcaceae bacterium]|nr:hypothetical protein [Oscillospiraceae bacterium]
MRPNADVTLYMQRGKNRFERIYVPQAFWQEGYDREKGNDGTRYGASPVRIVTVIFELRAANLADFCGAGKERSYIIRGKCTEEISDEQAHGAFVAKHSPFTIKTVTKCDYGNMQHWEVEGQ